MNWPFKTVYPKTEYKEGSSHCNVNNIVIAGFWSILAITISAFWNQMTQVKTHDKETEGHCILKVSGSLIRTIIYKMNIMFYYIGLETSDWAHKLKRKGFTKVITSQLPRILSNLSCSWATAPCWPLQAIPI